MGLTTEAIVAIVGIFVTLFPTILLLRRCTQLRKCRQRDTQAMGTLRDSCCCLTPPVDQPSKNSHLSNSIQPQSTNLVSKHTRTLHGRSLVEHSESGQRWCTG